MAQPPTPPSLRLREILKSWSTGRCQSSDGLLTVLDKKSIRPDWPLWSISRLAGECNLSVSILSRFVKEERIGMDLDTFNIIGAHLGLGIVPLGDSFYYHRGVAKTIDHFLGRDPKADRPDLKGPRRDPCDIHMREFLTVLLPEAKRELSLRNFAKRLGVNHTTIGRFLDGTSSLGLKTIDKIFVKLGLEIRPGDLGQQILDGPTNRWSVPNHPASDPAHGRVQSCRAARENCDPDLLDWEAAVTTHLPWHVRSLLSLTRSAA